MKIIMRSNKSMVAHNEALLSLVGLSGVFFL